jgi:Resolvase, N terminal domain/Recombinase
VARVDDDLVHALELIAAGEADALFVERVGALAGSLRELVRLLEWLTHADADLIATDVGLDTGTASGRRAVALLREIEGWERDRPRGRPGLSASAPDLAERIAGLRDRGLSLHGIAAELNAQRIPTPRGGAMWRPSSVQAALGYRRPRPPAPGAPPPKPPGRPTRPGPPRPRRPKPRP